jgi:hypothetical protein
MKLRVGSSLNEKQNMMYQFCLTWNIMRGKHVKETGYKSEYIYVKSFNGAWVIPVIL